MAITVSMREAKNRFTELARQAEAGETITVTRNGKPVADIVGHADSGKPKLKLDAAREWMDQNGYDRLVTWISPDFDEPLPEDFLINPDHWPENW